ncbi:MAG: transcriptional regulator [Polyangiaceae bacterium]|nr:transcriptional regulator [Polyangiaceae bacterium]
MDVLHSRRLGASIAVLREELQTSRATLYRDLALLQEAGVRIQADRVNGEARYRLLQDAMPALAPTVRQFVALRLARTMLEPLAGTALCDELDALLAKAAPPKAGTSTMTAQPAPRGASSPEIVRCLEVALERRHRVQLLHRGGRRGEPRWRTVDPICFHLVQEHLYFVAHDLEKDAPRAFKVVRIPEARATEEPAGTHPEVDLAALFRHAVKVWTGDPVDVAVWLASNVAWKAAEWPLHADQVVEPQGDGGCIVRARVAGVTEAMRWVLGWGAAARALEPPELTALVLGELTGAVARYPSAAVREDAPVLHPAKAKQAVSPIVRRTAFRIGPNRPAATETRPRSMKRNP